MTQTSRMPVVYIPHGGGPWPFVDLGFPADEIAALERYLRGLPSIGASRPKAVLAVSAHWEEAVPTVMTAAHPPLLFDYYGFPPEAYQVEWPAPGDHALATRVRELLTAGSFTTAANPDRGFDHGVFVPLKLAFPDADVPTVQLSLKKGLDPEEHMAMGRALAPLRDEGVLIVASGMSFHNLRTISDPDAAGDDEAFDAWLARTVSAEPTARANKLSSWAAAPSARAAHPREEHLLPLMVAAGAAGDDPGSTTFQGTFMGKRISGYTFA